MPSDTWIVLLLLAAFGLGWLTHFLFGASRDD